jgi:hypothetical protein
VCLIGVALSAREGRADASPIQPDFAALLQEFRSGDADWAVAKLAAWPAADVERAPDTAEKNAWLVAARVLLHTEAGQKRGDFAAPISGRQFTTSLEQIIPLSEYEPHYRLVVPLIESLLPAAATDPALAVFVRNWHILATPNAGGFGSDVATLPGAMAPRRFPSDSSSWLLYGSFVEPTLTHQFSGEGFAYHGGFIGRRSLRTAIAGRRPDTFKRNSQGDLIDLAQVQLAEHAFRRSIDLAPDNVEARLRLGRVLWRADRWAEAESELRKVTERATGTDRLFSGYLAWLWLGQMKEVEREWNEAARSYEQATLIRPEARSARMALAALRARLGLSGQAWSAAESLVRGRANPEIDPLTLYPHAQSWRHDQVRNEMRLQVRRR